MVDRRTDLVIEGFPRCGNTFALIAFLMGETADRKPTVAHHCHVSSQIVLAARWGIPALVLIREPADAVVSLALRLPFLSLRQGLRSYWRFYEPLLGLESLFLLVPFERLTSDFGAVIRDLNQRFGCDFSPFEHSAENERRCFELVEERHRARFGVDKAVESMVARPSATRAELRRPLDEAITGPGLAAPLERARSIYRRLRAAADKAGVDR